MTKPRSRNRTKQQQILNAATELFTEQGYHATSMALIAQHANVSKQTVYSHFGSKEELFAAAIEQKCDTSGLLDINHIDLSDPKSALLAVAKRFFLMVTSKEALAVHKICAYESKKYPQLSELFYQAGPERLTADVAKLLAELNARQLISIKAPHTAAVQFLLLMKGEAWGRVEFNTPKQLSNAEIDEYLSDSVDFFLRGYSPE
ncbi:TetR/AcrR family transcriptional regulator [Thalassotalea euphylliae]|uniref:TetR/AcrR family transcriptional regulator n=1 Tax=Thalassotalea euphylliae TaxID=1655234 RepID=A0A3E0UJC9_9GAMM|nr:TetR/AcrR family transcriptional regulator [Thalassotalea euphylliae]REL36727.1 TetR/AcrR family transcriptional regulator [Thalassotalea euphylliae]